MNFFHTEFIEITNVMVFGIYRDRIIRISKMLVTLCKMFESPEKRKLSKPEFKRDRSVFS